MRKLSLKPLALAVLGTFLFTIGCNCRQGAPVAAKRPDPPGPPPAIEKGKPWTFVVSGDSRNCGDVVMPAIAQGAAKHQAQFYWHLGDLRAIYRFDEDMVSAAKKNGKDLYISDYLNTAWNDFEDYQIAPFGKIPFRIGIGNHETIPPKSRCEFAKRFDPWLHDPALKIPATPQPKAGTPESTCPACPADCAFQPPVYYSWTTADDRVEFIYLDNASDCEFDDAQLKWFMAVADAAANNSTIQSVVVGMHAALPESISKGHSMNEWRDKPWPRGIATGTDVYNKLLWLKQEKKKNVYVLASHSHYVMEDVYQTPYWQKRKAVLDGWIVGTAGAERYRLPEQSTWAKFAKTDVYGYLVGTVSPDGSVRFNFEQIDERDIPPYVSERYEKGFVNWCFTKNKK